MNKRKEEQQSKGFLFVCVKTKEDENSSMIIQVMMKKAINPSNGD